MGASTRSGCTKRRSRVSAGPASLPITPEHQARVCTPRYFQSVEVVCRALHEEGYNGPVCIDSMALADGGLVPVVEVNARLSLGRVNHHLDEFLGTFGRRSYFSSIRTSLRREQFEEFFETLSAAGGVYGADSEEGLVPLSSNTLGINSTPGRLYFAIPFRQPEDVQKQLEKLHRVLGQLGAKMF